MSFNILINSLNLTGGEFKIIGFFLVITISLCIRHQAVKGSCCYIYLANTERNRPLKLLVAYTRTAVKYKRCIDFFMYFLKHVKAKLGKYG